MVDKIDKTEMTYEGDRRIPTQWLSELRKHGTVSRLVELAFKFYDVVQECSIVEDRDEFFPHTLYVMALSYCLLGVTKKSQFL